MVHYEYVNGTAVIRFLDFYLVSLVAAEKSRKAAMQTIAVSADKVNTSIIMTLILLGHGKLRYWIMGFSLTSLTFRNQK